jgi:hypothetical protein
MGLFVGHLYLDLVGPAQAQPELEKTQVVLQIEVLAMLPRAGEPAGHQRRCFAGRRRALRLPRRRVAHDAAPRTVANDRNRGGS